MKRFALLFAVAVSLAACNLDTTPPGSSTEPSDPATETFHDSLKINIATMTRTAAGDYYKDVTIGTGATLTTPNTVIVVSYLGFLKNAAVWASVYQQTTILAGLVGGLQDGMIGMKVGGERIVVVPSANGFGPVQNGGIPPNSTLVIDVRLDQIP